jgi:hypothetical protein
MVTIGSTVGPNRLYSAEHVSGLHPISRLASWRWVPELIKEYRMVKLVLHISVK